MDYLSVFLTILAAAIGFFMVFRKFRFYQENKEIDPSLSFLIPPSSLSPSPVPPSSLSHNWTLDVFPSFRGEDVRIDFLSHIQKEFQRKGITTFDDNGIKRGESIGPELIRAIRGSKIAIVLLSRNYASSKWCLDELVEIMKCREELGQTVLAIFYRVDPSDVKKLAGDFGKVFKKTCAGKTKEVIEGWRQALVTVATIAGYDSNNWNSEAAMIERIAIDVSNELINSVPSSDFNGFVGMAAHMRKMEQLLLLGSNEVRMIGIWGPSGIGKSTIARVLYSNYSHQFQLSVFMENVKRRSPRPCYDEYSAKLQLQKELLSQIFNLEDIKNHHHLGVVPDRLKDKRVLVVLDDVDHLMQLDAMAKESWWFGPGSRIIITTQYRRILNAQRINHIYKVDFPSYSDAVEIFCIYAFGQKSPYDGFRKLAWEVTELTGKLPLGLRVMGSYFKGMPKQEWTKALPRLRASLDGEIESILQFSFDALFDEEKALFLYIACFFNGEAIEKVEAFLAEKFSDVEGSLRILAEKSLISIQWERFIDMHTLLSRLGTEIVRKQSINEPGLRQFLVDFRDIRQVLCNDSVSSRSVIGIRLKYSELEISDGAFERMSSVQFLRLCCPFIPLISERLNCLPREVRLLHWENFPMTCLPCCFNTEFLVEINMCHSNLEKLWEGVKTIKNLKWMDLDGSINLKELPDLSTATNLIKLKLSGCSSLVELPSSIGNATHLRELDLRGCSSLVKLPSSIGNAINLQKLVLSECTSLVKLSFSMENATNFKVLDLQGCLHLLELPSSIGNLKELYLDNCSSLVKLPSSIRNACYLEEFTCSGCSSLVDFPPSIGKEIYFRQLDMSGCSSLVELPSYFGNMIHLSDLFLDECSSLVKLPFSIGNMIDLKMLSLNGCSSLVELPSAVENMNNLEDLSLNECSSLVELPSSIGNIRKLKRLYLAGCSKLRALPININMKSLDELDLTGCSLLKSFPEISTNVSVLMLKGTAIEEIPPSIRSWSRLDSLHMSYCENVRKSQHAFDRITELHCSDTTVHEIAPCIKEMSRLRKLVIKGCTKLVSLPQLPKSLAILDAENCESLERLDRSLNKTMFTILNLLNCFKLNQEARDLIFDTSTRGRAFFPGEKVPTYFTYRATGSSLSVNLNGYETHFSTLSRLKACVLMVKKVDVEVGDRNTATISCYINDERCTQLWNQFSLSSKEHLFVFEETVSSTEVVFKFELDNEGWEIKECGVRPHKP
ncbi:unnamed protein product [Microthlaspi erraticum]|uniref:ADP-ribosyl cyclase/cyclic ADP-ribose hydrolase n=1 Tax=Microthlaspi erraticum TaxID=1685480 RepID=A0A6D2ILA1_9BRAS|nr:unnamed protein product [Microthlaspi erraticum]